MRRNNAYRESEKEVGHSVTSRESRWGGERATLEAHQPIDSQTADPVFFIG